MSSALFPDMSSALFPCHVVGLVPSSACANYKKNYKKQYKMNTNIPTNIPTEARGDYFYPHFRPVLHEPQSQGVPPH